MPKKPSHYTSSTSLIISASATSATACTTKISPAGARSTSRATPTCCCGSRTRGQSSPPLATASRLWVNCARIFANAQNARRCSPVSDIPITEKLLLNAGGWQAMKPARELLKSGRVSEAKYEAPLLSGYVREGAKNYRSGLRIKSAIDIENLCSCWESRSAGKICAHSVAVGLGYLNPPAAVVTVPNEPAMPEAPAGPQFVPADSADAALKTLHVILPPNFAGAWQKGQIMIVVEAEVSRKRTLVSALPKKKMFVVDGADLALIESLRAVPAIFKSGMAILSRDAFLRLLPALQNHPRVTFGKATRATISSAALRSELLVESRGEGISVRANFPAGRGRKIEHDHEHEQEHEHE